MKQIIKSTVFCFLMLLIFLVKPSINLSNWVSIASADELSTTLKNSVVADWQRQEQRLNRSFDSLDALTELADRAEKLHDRMLEEDLISVDRSKELRQKIAAARIIVKSVQSEQVKQGQSSSLSNTSPETIQKLYLDLRWTMRDVIFDNPLIKGSPIVFMKGDRYIWQLIHEYLSFYYRYTNRVSGGFHLLKNPGRSFETTDLTKGKFPRGSFSTPSLSYDAKTLYFAYADFSKVVPEGTPAGDRRALVPDYRTLLASYKTEKEGKYHLFKMNLQNGQTKQLTEGPNDDFDPVLLPDGSIVFVSTRRGGFARCTGKHEPVQTATLHKLLANGEVECLSWHETGEWNPAVLADGRIVYSRWDYVDREAARYMNLWVTNPDGTGTQALFGNYTENVVASLQSEEIPGSNKIMFVGSGHHVAVGGPLVILDPTKVSYDPETGEDRMDSLDVLTPEIGFPETAVPNEPKHWCIPDHYFYSPYPLSEDFYLTSFSHDPNGGWLAQNFYGPRRGNCGDIYTAGRLGLYYFDRFGNLELIYEDPKTSCRYPLQLRSRPVPRTIASKLPKAKSDFGTFVLSNVNESLVPFPKDRPIREIRVFQLFPKEPGFIRDDPKVSHATAANTRMYLGSVPVESDGSAHFKVPARKPLYFQAVDQQGRAVRTMLSDVYLQPGENRGCIGCHEQAQTTQKNLTARNKALGRAPSILQPGPVGTQPFSYPILVQSILDRSCTSCHNGKKEGAKPQLTGEVQDKFTVSYNSLRPYLKWYGWGTTIQRITSSPGKSGADMSKLTAVLDDKNHSGKIKLSETDRRTLYLWMDANVPFFGTEEPEEMARQLKGETIAVTNRQ